MERFDIFYKFGSIAIGGFIGFLWGGWSTLLQILIFFAVVDYLTGFLAAGVEGKLKSTIGFRGIAKKVMLFFMVAVAHQIDVVLGDNHMFRDATIFFYIANELLSIIENAGRIGIYVPEPLKKAVQILKSKGE